MTIETGKYYHLPGPPAAEPGKWYNRVKCHVVDANRDFAVILCMEDCAPGAGWVARMPVSVVINACKWEACTNG